MKQKTKKIRRVTKSPWRSLGACRLLNNCFWSDIFSMVPKKEAIKLIEKYQTEYPGFVPKLHYCE